MSLFKKFHQILGIKASAKETLELLTNSLTETDDQVLRYEGVHGRTIQRHVLAAEASCKQAFKALKQDDQKGTTRFAKTGLIHLHIARLLLTGKQHTKIQLQAAPDTTEGALNYLINQIAKAKLIVEYGDLKVSSAVQEALLHVMKIFDAAVADLRKWHLADSRRETGAAMVALHWTICLLQADNPDHDLSDLKMPLEGAQPAELKACELADKIVECRTFLTEMQTIAVPEVASHLYDADEKFESCLENLIDGDREQTALDARAGLMDIKLAIRASKEELNAGERRQNSQARMAIGQFDQDVHRILRLAEELSIDSVSLQKRLTAAQDYFMRAQRALHRNDLVEADRLSRAAHLDLDFSWQIANAVRKAEYRQDI